MRGRRAAAQAAALIFAFALPPAYGGVIPLPAEVVTGPGLFNVDRTTALHALRGDRDAGDAARYLAGLWTRTNGLTLPVITDRAKPGDGTHSIVFTHRGGLGPEAYEITVMPQQITVSASSAAGLFYGAVTLWQLLPPGNSSGEIPAQTIRDAPVYPWRGLMLDSARHFQSPAFVRSMIDWMAWHKLNVLHWHLTDDQGWRLEIRRHPRLTSIGGWRVEPGGARYGGFYTQEDVREIVRFAAARHVQIVPEIDLPGHATAAIAAYPTLGARPAAEAVLPVTGAAAPVVSSNWGVLTHLFNLEPQTFRFLEDVLAEVIELFPSPLIHIGGDEVVKDEWIASPAVQARARQLGLLGPGALQPYFTQRLARYLAARGRRVIGWDEILQPGLPRGAVVMSWHGVSGAHTAAVAGNDAVLAPDPGLYFDHRQSTLPAEPPGRLAVLSLEDVYRFQPFDPALSDRQRRRVLGLQGNVWTEHIRTEERVEWMTLPRAAALAEVGWSKPERRSWPNFLERLAPMFARYRSFGLNYSDSVFAPAARVSRSGDNFSVALSNQAQSGAASSGEIRYTLDGSEPLPKSARYESPLALPAGAEIRAAAFAGPARISRTWAQRLDAQAASRRDSHSLEQCSDGIGLLLEPLAGDPARPPLALDIMNPCWIDRGVDLSAGPALVAAVAPLPFNYEIGAAAAQIRVGDARSGEGELEIHVDGCSTPALLWLPLASAAYAKGVTTLPAQQMPRLPGRHDLCLRFARPRLDPQWALDWIEIRE